MNIIKSGYTQKIFDQYRVNITDSGFASVDTDWNSSYVCSPFSRLYYILDGYGEIQTKNRIIKLLPGQLHLIPLGTKYSCRCKEFLDHLYFHINIDAPSGYDLLRGFECTQATIGKDKISHLKDLYLSSEFLEQLELKYEIHRSIHRLISLQTSSEEFETSLSPEVAKTIDFIRNNLSIQLTTAEIAEKLFLSKNTLAKHFKNELGLPIGKYIDKLIFFEAEMLLTKTSLSIKDISERLGFCDQFYFSRRFMQIFEETPLSYRKRTKTSAT